MHEATVSMRIITMFFYKTGINGKSKADDSSESEEEEEEKTPKTKKVITTPQTFPKVHAKVRLITQTSDCQCTHKHKPAHE